MTDRWAQLRQVGIATLDHEAEVAKATAVLGLGPGFADPELEHLGLLDFTVPVGPHAYLEILAPATPDHSLVSWLRRKGGAAGWVLSTQVPDLDGVRERCAEQGMRVVTDTAAMGHEILQLHPRDAGVLLELDAFAPQDQWFWDDLPANQAAQQARGSVVDDIVAVVIACAEPHALATRWARVLGLAAPEGVDGEGASLALGERIVDFVPSVDGKSGLVGMRVRAVDRSAAGRTAELCGVQVVFE
jgi:hypothetical protein